MPRRDGQSNSRRVIRTCTGSAEFSYATRDVAKNPLQFTSMPNRLIPFRLLLSRRSDLRSITRVDLLTHRTDPKGDRA
jgi:hypothetical protein